MMLEEQVGLLRENFGTENVSVAKVSGGWQVDIANVCLPKGWSHEKTTVVFLVPHAYPAAALDCFWTRDALNVNGLRPKSSNDTNPMPDGSLGTWFAWRPQIWDPNSDTLSSYVRVITNRLRQVR